MLWHRSSPQRVPWGPVFYFLHACILEIPGLITCHVCVCFILGQRVTAVLLHTALGCRGSGGCDKGWGAVAQRRRRLRHLTSEQHSITFGFLCSKNEQRSNEMPPAAGEPPKNLSQGFHAPRPAQHSQPTPASPAQPPRTLLSSFWPLLFSSPPLRSSPLQSATAGEAPCPHSDCRLGLCPACCAKPCVCACVFLLRILRIGFFAPCGASLYCVADILSFR